MKAVTIDLQTFDNARADLTHIVAGTVLYKMYMTQPLADENSINNELRQHIQDIARLKQAIKEEPKDTDELMIAKRLTGYLEFMKTQRVQGKDYMKQRDAIADEIVKKIPIVIDGDLQNDLTRHFLSVVNHLRDAYYEKNECY